MESSTRKLRRKPLSDLTNINPSHKQPSPSTPKPKSNPISNPNPKSKSKLIDNTSTNIGSPPRPESIPRCIESTSASVGSTPKSDSNPNSKSCGDTSTNIGSTPKPKPEVNPKSKSKSIENTSPCIGSNVPTPTSTTPNNCDAHCEQTPLVNNYGKQQTVAKAKGKEKLVDVVPFSCPPAGTSRSIENELETQQRGKNRESKVQSGVDPSKTRTVPRQKRKKDPFKTYTVPRQKSKKMPRLSLPAPKPKLKDLVIKQLPKDFVIEQNKYFAEVDAFELEEEVVNENDLE